METTYRSKVAITAGNRRRAYARLAVMMFELRDSSVNLVSLTRDPDGRLRVVLSNAVSQAALDRYLLELHPSP